MSILHHICDIWKIRRILYTPQLSVSSVLNFRVSDAGVRGEKLVEMAHEQEYRGCLVFLLCIAINYAAMQHVKIPDCIQKEISGTLSVNNTDNDSLECFDYLTNVYRQLQNNFTKEEINYIRSLDREGLSLLYGSERSKRQMNVRYRRECRTLSDTDRNNLFYAFRRLKFDPGLVGLALVAVGAIIKHGSDVIGDVLAQLKHVPAVSSYLDTAAWVLIGLGIFFTAIGVLGGCGACCAVKIFLILYAIIVIILMLTQIVFIALLFSDKLKDILQSVLKDSFGKYKPPPDPAAGAVIDTSDALSRGLDALFLELKCCGFESSKDLTNAPKTPVTCCKAFTPELLKSGNPFGTGLVELKTCVNTGANSYKDRGCYDALVDLINDNKGPFIGGTVGILLFQLICVVFAILIVKDKNKNSVSPIT